MIKTKIISIFVVVIMILETILPTSFSVAQEVQSELLNNSSVSVDEEIKTNENIEKSVIENTRESVSEGALEEKNEGDNNGILMGIEEDDEPISVIMDDEIEWIIISSADQLNNIRNNLAGNYKLGADIDLSSYENWEPIASFTGKFDGDNHIISNLTISRESEDNVGLFGSGSGTLSNVKLQNVSVVGKDNTGALIGNSTGIIENIEVISGNIVGNSNVGAIVGKQNKKDLIVNNCVARVSVQGVSNVGGLAGYLSGCLELSYTTGHITGTTIVGGLVGYFVGTINKCYSTGSVVGTEDTIGGLVGFAGYLSSGNCPNELVNSYSTSSVEGRNNVGGILGYARGVRNFASGSHRVISCNIQNVYAIGEVNKNENTTDENTIGGIVGKKDASYFTISNSYWATDTTKQEISSGGEARTIFDMAHESNYVDWDFENVWVVEENRTTAYLAELPKPESVKADGLEGVVYFEGGDGTEENPYLIRTPEQLNAVRNSLGKNYKLLNDIDLSEYENWEPIGNSEYNFTGSLDGDGYKIINLTIDREEEDNVGLFGYSTGILKNIKLEDSNVKGKDNVGILVGYSTGNINDIEFRNNELIGNDCVGMLAGYSAGNVENIEVISGNIEGNSSVGAIIGKQYNKSSILKNCISRIDVQGVSDVGGLVGFLSGSIELSYAMGNVNGTSNVGGLVGYLVGTVNKCYSTGNVVGIEDNIGGLVGYSGFLPSGNCPTELINSYSTSSVEGRDNVGGILGNARGYRDFQAGSYRVVSCNIQNVYAIGEINKNENTTDENTIGGIVGRKDGSYFSIGNSYWTPETTKIAISAGGTEHTIAQMITEDEYITWDFDEIWTIEEGKTAAYLAELPRPDSVVLVIGDDEAPVVTKVETSDITSHSITFNMKGKDVDSGVKDIKLYVNGELVKHYVYQTGTTDLKEETFVLDNLRPNTDYVYYIEVVDFAGTTKRTNDKEARTLDINNVTITPDTIELTTNDVTVTMEAELYADQKIQYSYDGKTWIDYEEPIVITSNRKILGRVTDGVNHSDISAILVDNIDKYSPIVVGKYYETKLQLDLKDVGVAGLDYYQYVVMDRWLNENEEPVYGSPITINPNVQNLIDLIYTGENIVYVKVVDTLGNETIKVFDGKYLPDTRINVEIEKVSNRSEAIKLEGAKFFIKENDNSVVESETEVTDENGIARFTLKGKQIGTYGYQLKEVEAPTGYNAISDSILNITYNYYGEVANVTCGNNKVVIEEFDKQKIKIKVVDDKQNVSEYKLIVKAYDSKYPERYLQGVKYQANVRISEGAASFTTSGITNSNGEYVADYLSGSGEIEVKIKQLESILGYRLNEDETTMVFNRELENGKLSIIPEKNSENLRYEINNDTVNPQNSLVVIYVANEPLEKENSLTLVLKEITRNDVVNIENLRFTLEQPYELGEIIGTTNEDGMLTFNNLVPLFAGDYIYKITSENNNYNLEEIRVIVTFNKYGEITNVQKITDNITSINNRSFVEDEKYYINYDINISIDNSARLVQRLKLRNMDFEDDTLLLPGVKYLIKISNEESLRNIEKITDEFGEFSFDVYADENSTITIKQIKNIAGYLLDDSERDLCLKYNEDAERLYVDYSETDDNLSIEENENEILIKDYSKKKIRGDYPGNIDLFIAKHISEFSESGLGKVKFNVEEKTTRDIRTVETDEDGNVVLRNFAVSGPGEYEFEITEIESVYGYKQFEEPVKIQIIYEEIDNELKTTSIVYTQGYKYVKYSKCDEYETDTKYQLDINLDLVNELQDNVLELTDLILQKTGSIINSDEKQVQSNVVFEFKVVYENEKSIKFRDRTNREGKIETKIYVPEGVTRINIREISGHAGYASNGGEFVVTKQNGNVTVTGPERDNVQAEYSNNAINITLNNELLNPVSDEDEPVEIGEVETPEVDPQPGEKTFDIVLKNESTVNSAYNVEWSRFNVKIEQNNEYVCRYNAFLDKTPGPSNRNAMAIKGLTLVGDMRVHVQQTTPPTNHIINKNKYKIDLNRDGEIEQIYLNGINITEGIDVEIDNVNNIVYITIFNDPADLMLGVIKTDNKNPDIQLAGAKFKVGTRPDGSVQLWRWIATLETNDEGYGSAILNKNTTSATNNITNYYSITEVEAPNGYTIAGAVVLAVTTNRNGEISSATITEGREYAMIRKIEGKYIEVEILDIRDPGPEYTVKVITKNKDFPDMIVNGAKYNVKIHPEVGCNTNSNIGGYYYNSDGRIVYRDAILRGLTGSGRLDIDVKQVGKAPGYKMDTKTYSAVVDRIVTQIVTTETGNAYTNDLYLNNETDSSVEVEVNNLTKEVIFTIYNEPEEVIILEKVDEEDETIKLSGAKFRVESSVGEVHTGITGTSGIAFIPLGKPARNQTIRYTVTEMVAPLYYDKITDAIVFEITYNENGKIVSSSLIGGNDYVTRFRTAPLGSCVDIRVIDKKHNSGGNSGNQEETGIVPFDFELEKTNVHNQLVKIKNVVFSINVQAETGETVECIKVSNDNGVINLNNIAGTGKITIDLEEKESSNGYALDSTPRRITIIKTGDVISLVQDETSADLNVTITQKRVANGVVINPKVKVTITNKVSLDSLGLALIKEDYNNRNIKLSGANFVIKDVDTDHIYEKQDPTDENGLMYFVLPIKQYPGTATYKITETQTPNGYYPHSFGDENIDPWALNVAVTLLVDYNADGTISEARILENTDLYEVTVVKDRYVEIHIRNRKMPIYNLTVYKADWNDIEIPIANTLLGISINNEIGGNIYREEYTDENGEININNIGGLGNIGIDIDEKIPAEGRRFDGKEKSATLERNVNTGNFVLKQALNVDVIIDNDNNHIKVIVRNKELPNLYTFVLVKKDDKEINTLANARFKIEIPENGIYERVTDSNGRIVLQGLEMPTNIGTYTAKIKEIEAPAGYEIIEDDIYVDITFGAGNQVIGEDPMIIKNAEVTQNKEVARVLEYKPQYVKVLVKDKPKVNTGEQGEINIDIGGDNHYQEGEHQGGTIIEPGDVNGGTNLTPTGTNNGIYVDEITDTVNVMPDGTKSNKKLPQTGSNESIYIIICIAVIGCVVLFKKYKKAEETFLNYKN